MRAAPNSPPGCIGFARAGRHLNEHPRSKLSKRVLEISSSDILWRPQVGRWQRWIAQDFFAVAADDLALHELQSRYVTSSGLGWSDLPAYCGDLTPLEEQVRWWWQW